jgi:glycogen debranching enzyme
MTDGLQPLLHDQFVLLRAPAQAWSAHDGTIDKEPIHGIYVSDVRVVAEQRVGVASPNQDPRAGEHIATSPDAADRARFVRLHRDLDDPGADPDVRSELERVVTSDGARHTLHLSSRLSRELPVQVTLDLTPDVTPIDAIKAGINSAAVPSVTLTKAGARWQGDAVSATLAAEGAELALCEGGVRAVWRVTLPARGSARVSWTVTSVDADAVVAAPSSGRPWTVPAVHSDDERLARWVARAVDDLDALRLELPEHPGEQFLAAGAPWFFTLFGRDSLWVARLLLPLGTDLARGTLRVLAGLQGRASVPDTAEQPGKIMHELRRGTLEVPGEGISLPPLYYGTVDATALWVCLLHDAWRWGLDDADVAALVPHLRAALAWMRDFGDSDGDGLLEYVDETGTGLSNQGWKDSGDSVQWRDGSLAEGPIALCEVQAYAYEAAMHGANLLDAFGEPGESGPWREWAGQLCRRFAETFWIEHHAGAYPAIALDARKRPVDTVTSNLGHLLGTGLLDARQSALVARRLASPEMASGYGLRTLSTDAAGYCPLGYHSGSVWTHDTAIAIIGLVRDGHRAEADLLIEGLLAAAAGFDYRLPELHSGDSADDMRKPVPYPAACRPQAWSAAAAVGVLASVLGLDARGGELAVSPGTVAGAVRAEGLRFGGSDVAIEVNADGKATAVSGAPVVVDRM